MKAPADPLIKALDDARLLQRAGAIEISERAGYHVKMWHSWMAKTPMQIKALQDIAAVLGLEIVVRPKSLDSTDSGRHL